MVRSVLRPARSQSARGAEPDWVTVTRVASASRSGAWSVSVDHRRRVSAVSISSRALGFGPRLGRFASCLAVLAASELVRVAALWEGRAAEDARGPREQ